MAGWLDESRVAALSGGAAGLTTVLVLHPLDVVKTRLQGAQGVSSCRQRLWLRRL